MSHVPQQPVDSTAPPASATALASNGNSGEGLESVLRALRQRGRDGGLPARSPDGDAAPPSRDGTAPDAAAGRDTRPSRD